MILVDWSPLCAFPWYAHAVINTRTVGNYLSKFLNFIVSNGVPIKSIHLIGFSLGAEIAGFTGKDNSFGKLPRITGKFLFIFRVYEKPGAFIKILSLLGKLNGQLPFFIRFCIANMELGLSHMLTFIELPFEIPSMGAILHLVGTSAHSTLLRLSHLHKTAFCDIWQQCTPVCCI